MTVHRPDEFFARLGRGGLIGFGEAYLTGAWDADDLARLPHRAGRRHVDAGAAGRCRSSARSPYAARRATSAAPDANTQHNIAHHYDLSNDLFALSSTRR